MPRHFVSRFVLPLVQGGPVHVGRPIGARVFAEILRAGTDPQIAAELAHARAQIALRFLPDAVEPALDEATLRLAAGVHNLLLLAHPAVLRRGPRVGDAIAAAGVELADLGPPATAREAVERHALLARLPELFRSEHLVHFWAGQRVFVGRAPPRGLLIWPRLRRVRVESRRRLWSQEIGVSSVARPLQLALHRSSPLGEALDPLCLDPPLDWDRVLSVVRDPGLGRAIAAGLVDQGVVPAGAAVAAALFRYHATRTDPAAAADTGFGLGIGIRLLAHSFWLAQVLDLPRDFSAGSALDLVALLAAAAEVAPQLAWPPDVPQESKLGSELGRRFAAMRVTALAQDPGRVSRAVELCRKAGAKG